MSTNCLITKLKGSVNDDNLPIYNTIVFDVPANVSSLTYRIGGLKNVTFKITGDVVMKNSSETNVLCDNTKDYNISSPISENIYTKISSGDTGGTLALVGKYSISEIATKYDALLFPVKNEPNTLDYYTSWGFNTKVFNPARNLGLRVSITEVIDAFPELGFINIPAGANVTGSFADMLPIKSTLLELSVGIPTSFTKAANINEFSEFTALIRLVLYYNISGSIEDFVRSQIANGRTTGSMAVNLMGVTFNGIAVSSGNKSLSWTSTTATLDGVTVEL